MKELKTFDGHLVLLCKGHYQSEDESLTFLDYLKRIWAVRCGLDIEHVDSYSYGYIANRLYKILIGCKPSNINYIMDIIHRELTSNVGYRDNLTPIEKLIYIYKNQIADLQVRNEGETLISLPNPQKEIFNRILNGNIFYGDYELITNSDLRTLENPLIG